MNPILLYPQNAADAKFFRECAEKRGAKPTSLSLKDLEKFDEIMFAEYMKANETGITVPREEVDALFDSLIDGK